MRPAAARSTASTSRPDSYLEHIVERFGSDLTGLKIGVDCANGAYSEIAPRAFEQLGRRASRRSAPIPTARTSTRAAAQPTFARCSEPSTSNGARPRRRVRRRRRQDARRRRERRTSSTAITSSRSWRSHLGVELVAVTVMSNLGLHRLLDEHGIRVVTTPVGDRYVLEALREHGGVLGGEQSGHIIYLRDHVTGDGLAAALLLCDAIRGRTLGEAAAVMPTFPQVKENLPLSRSACREALARRGRTAQRGAERRRACARARIGYGAGRAAARRGSNRGRGTRALC